jgi:hypothetical protein
VTTEKGWIIVVGMLPSYSISGQSEYRVRKNLQKDKHSPENLLFRKTICYPKKRRYG